MLGSMRGLICCAFLVVGANTAGAVPLFGDYPAPGNNNFTGVGNASTGTRTVTYSGFDNTQYDQLWWGATIGASTDGTNPPPSMTTVTITNLGQTATWYGTSILNTNSGVHTVNIEFVANITAGSTSWLVPGSVDISGPGAVLQVNGDFTLTEQFLASIPDFSTPLLPLNTLYQNYKNQFAQQPMYFTSIDGRFWYTPPLDEAPGNTPLPAALPLFATGLGALGLFGWRRKRKSA